MNLHKDLYTLAKEGILVARGRPRQGVLRKTIANAYYALFHLLTYEGSIYLIGKTRGRRALRTTTRRAFGHGDMRTAAAGFARSNPSQKLDSALGNRAVSGELVLVAETFVTLQDLRHAADYDLAKRFTKGEAVEAVTAMEQAFAAWETIRDTSEARVSLVALLLLRSMRQ